MGRKRSADKPARRTIREMSIEEQQLHHNTLALALLRAKTVQLHSHELISHARPDNDRSMTADILMLQPTAQVRGHQASWLYFACAEVAMELWEARVFPAEEITERMADPEKRKILTGMRDVIFHGLPITDGRLSAFYDNWESVEQWVTPIIDAMALYTRNWFIARIEAARRV
jgi:hypothetical protein